MTEIIKNYINGALVDGDGSFIDKYYPATGEVIAKVSVASAELLDEAVAKASEEFAARRMDASIKDALAGQSLDDIDKG